METTSHAYQYHTLNPATSLRLLDILPAANSNSPIRIHLRHTTVDAGEPYEALSYTWGLTSDPQTLHVVCDGDEGDSGATLSVTQNCFAALHRLRLPETRRVLWVDAICINQGDVTERSQQVGLMGRIYHGAEQVLIWLGAGTPDSDLAVEFLVPFKEILEVRGIERANFVEGRDGVLRGRFFFFFH